MGCTSVLQWTDCYCQWIKCKKYVCVCVVRACMKVWRFIIPSVCAVLNACLWVTTLSTLKDLFAKCILLHNLIPKASTSLQCYKFKMLTVAIWLYRSRAWLCIIITGKHWKPCLAFWDVCIYHLYIQISSFHLWTDVHAKYHKNARWVVQPCWGHMLITWSKE